ncbi:MAG: alpha/beta hydrolase [Sphingopyxis sp.]|nr:alpha/beta hydrolase [Sphingopyxis sp.]
MDILLIPGFMLDTDLWSDVRPEIARFGNIVDVDTTQDLTIEAMAARAVASIATSAIVVGFSMGGYVARQIAYRAPGLVRGLALVATSSRGSRPQPIMRSAANGFRELSRSAVVRSLHPEHRSEDRIERVQHMSRRLGGDAFFMQSRLQRDDDTKRLSGIACPTVVVAAAEDELRSVDESRTLHENIPNSTMTIIEGTGHLIPLERPAELMAALQPLLSMHDA